MSASDEILMPDDELSSYDLELFRREFMTTKVALLSRIVQIIGGTEGQISRLQDDNLELRRYLESKKENLVKFRSDVNETPLFEYLEDWWCYEFVIGDRGTALYLRHVAKTGINIDGEKVWLSIEEYDARFKLLETRCGFFTAEEFADERGVAPATVRVWIRRGKVRSAMKIANAWMVPKLTPPIKRGFSGARYEWDVYLGDVPAGFEVINEPGIMIIERSMENGKYEACYYNKNRAKPTRFILGGAEIEKLELYLIREPAIEYTGDTIVISR